MKFDIIFQMRDAKLKNNDYARCWFSNIFLHLEDISQPGVVFSISRLTETTFCANILLVMSNKLSIKSKTIIPSREYLPSVCYSSRLGGFLFGGHDG